ncbi:glycosyltransferase family 2 protein [Cognatilysobacter bugurensis]|uniref:Rhamnosyltransferase n=1 Tax=Cognatilysobacter bugurensis TaxID=543356 RepID=A0A918T5M3_9GAMM|nr:glycosyltransferase family 2 protein [Lysobacter bugurensis]GHA88872.1 rhamnosyltransferase [Lysobacter bugurensis]
MGAFVEADPKRATCAVIVTYHPDPAELPEVIARIAPQAHRVFIIDNASPPAHLQQALPAPLPDGVDVIRSATNDGLGRAYNRGAQLARQAGCRFVLLMDQDSVVAPDLVARLVDAHAQLKADARVGAVGAAFIDAHTGHPAPFVRIGFPLNRKIPAPERGCVECDFLISSGSLIELDVLDAVGGMDEALFIDNVDLEWSFRARASGYRLFGVGDARMTHRIGHTVRRLPLGLGDVVVHAPVRLYYMMRNRVLLYGRPQTPRVWIAQDLPRLALKLARLSLFVQPRRRNFRAMVSGLLDGLRGRSGPCTRIL